MWLLTLILLLATAQGQESSVNTPSVQADQTTSSGPRFLFPLESSTAVPTTLGANNATADNSSVIFQPQDNGPADRKVANTTASTTNSTTTTTTVMTNATSETSSSSSSTTPTTTASTTSTTEPTTLSPRMETEFQVGEHCTCDLTLATCDVNCCCDPDCSSADRRAFSRCLDQDIPDYDPRYCYNEGLLFSNNTQYKVAKISKDVFCIARDNLYHRTRFLEKSSTDNITDFKKMEDRHRKFQWEEEEDSVLVETRKHYLAGDPIWARYGPDEVFGHLQLPFTQHGGECLHQLPVRYMENHVVTCTLLIDDSSCKKYAFLNASNFLNSMEILALPAHLWIQSNITNRQMDRTEDFTENDEISNSSTTTTTTSTSTVTASTTGELPNENPMLVRINSVLCSVRGQEGAPCSDYLSVETVPAPSPDCRSRLLRSLHLDITHSGLDGINSVDAYVEVVDMDDEAGTELVQRFSYRHLWSQDNLTLEAIPITRSGNPGYQVGLPLISGSLAEDASGLPYVDISVDPEEQVSVFLAGDGGHCDLVNTRRQPLTFGENMLQGCSMHLNRSFLSEYCEQLKARSFQMLAGTKFSRKLPDRLVATFGNSLPNQTGDWVKVLYVDPPNYGVANKPFPGRCQNIVQSLHVQILYANIGSFSNPQAKILGVAYRFGKPRDIIFSCRGLACNHRSKTQRVDFSQSVSFLDVSEPARPEFAERPRLEAKFPADFFYPFVSSQASAPEAGWIFYIFAYVSCILYHFLFR